MKNTIIISLILFIMPDLNTQILNSSSEDHVKVDSLFINIIKINRSIEAKLTDLRELETLVDNPSKQEIINKLRYWTNEVATESHHYEDIVAIFHNMKFFEDKKYVLDLVVKSSRSTFDAIEFLELFFETDYKNLYNVPVPINNIKIDIENDVKNLKDIITPYTDLKLDIIYMNNSFKFIKKKY